jgi:hypothetical protein
MAQSGRTGGGSINGLPQDMASHLHPLVRSG